MRARIVWLLLCVIWGSTWLFIKLGLEDLPPISFAGIRFVIASLILLSIAVIRGRRLPRAFRDWALIGVTGVLAFAFNYGLLFWGEQHVTSGLAAVLQTTIPAFGLVIAHIHLPAERMTIAKVCGVALGVVGVAIIFSNQLSIAGPLALWGSAAIVVGAFGAAYSNVLVKARGGHIDPPMLAAGQMMFGLVPLLVVGHFVEGNPLRFHWTPLALVSLFYLVLVGSVVAFLLYYWLVRNMDVTKTMLISLVTPLIAVTLGMLVLDEKLSWRTVLGGACIMSGIGLIVLRRYKDVQSHRLVIRRSMVVVIAICLLSAHLTTAQESTVREGEWPAYGRDQGGSRYSPLTQISRVNVKNLKVAWMYRTGDVTDGKTTGGVSSAFEATPILVDGTLFLSTPFDRVIALDPRTGAERWVYDPKIDTSKHIAGHFVSRGVSTWLDQQASNGQARQASAVASVCRRRIFLGTLDARLIALDAATGRPCADFGDGGQVDLGAGVGNVQRSEYQVTSPPAVIGDLVIVGSAIGDNQRVKETSGAVRAFDVRTGRLRWVWDPVPRNSHDPAFQTWHGDSASYNGAANVWSIISADPARDLIFLPTTSPSPDYYGGERIGNNNYADSVVALRASTGRLVWHFQVVHHDLWDYDIPAQPALINVRKNGKDIPAVAVATKMGHLFILNREDGKPVFPVEERSVPQAAVEGEVLSPTQPFPTAPRPLVPQKLTADDAWGLTPADREQCRASISALRSEGTFTPPSLQGSIVFPGDVGGMNWSGVAFDSGRGLLITNTNRFARVVTLIPRAGLDRAKLNELRAASPDSEYASQRGTPYLMRREWWVSAHSVPCNPPPWGTLVAVETSTGVVRWEVPLGTMPELAQVEGSSR